MTRTLGLLKAFEPCIKGARPLRHCAIICPSGLQGSTTWEGGQHSDNEAVMAAFKLMQAGSIQCVAMPRDTLTDMKLLEEFSLIVLPSFESLSDDEAKCLEDYLSNGGGLLATGSRMLSRARTDASCLKTLQTLFKVEPASPGPALKALSEKFRWDQVGGAPYDCYFRCREGAFDGESFSARPMPAGEYEFAQALKGSKTLADIMIGGDAQGLTPGLIESSCGKGRAAIIPSSIELSWQASQSQRLCEFVAAICDRVPGRPQPFKLLSKTGNVFINVFATARGSLAVHIVDCEAGREAVSGLRLAVGIPRGMEAQTVERLSSASTSEFTQTDGWILFDGLSFSKGECIEITLCPQRQTEIPEKQLLQAGKLADMERENEMRITEECFH